MPSPMHKRTTALSTATPTPVHPWAGRAALTPGVTVVQNDANSTGALLLGDATMTSSSYGLALAAGASIVLPNTGGLAGLHALAATGTVNAHVLHIPDVS